MRGFIEHENRYVREPLHVRDWNKAVDIMRYRQAGLDSPEKAQAMQFTTIETWRDKFLENVRSENRSRETIRKYVTLFKQLLAFAADKGLKSPSDFDFGLVEAFRNSWKDAALAKSKKQERLRSVFKYALAHEWIKRNPAASLGSIKVKESQKLPFNDAELKRILDCAKSEPTTYVFILTLRYTGLRISDVSMLRVEALTDSNHIQVTTIKNNAKVKIKIPDVVAKMLRRVEKKHPDYFFYNGSDSLETVTNHWRLFRIQPVFKAAKIQNATPHRFRHTFASKLLVSGASVGSVAAALGNTQRIVERHYSAWIKERQDKMDRDIVAANGFHEIEEI